MFVNAVAEVATALSPEQLLATLHGLEIQFGRIRGAKNAARALDLDLLAYHDVIQPGPPCLPHPRMTERIFVMQPLCDIAANWVHPESGLTAASYLDKIQPDQRIRVLDGH